MPGSLHALFGPKHGPVVWLWILGGLVVSLVVLAALDRLPSRSKRRLIATTTFLAGLFYALEFFLPEKASWFPNAAHTNPLSPGVELMGKVVQVIFAFTIGLGVS